MPFYIRSINMASFMDPINTVNMELFQNIPSVHRKNARRHNKFHRKTMQQVCLWPGVPVPDFSLRRNNCAFWKTFLRECWGKGTLCSFCYLRWDHVRPRFQTQLKMATHFHCIPVKTRAPSFHMKDTISENVLFQKVPFLCLFQEVLSRDSPN